MKKVLLAFAVATIFAACEDSSKTDSTTTDSTTINQGTATDTGINTGTVTDTGRINSGTDTTSTGIRDTSTQR